MTIWWEHNLISRHSHSHTGNRLGDDKSHKLGIEHHDKITTGDEPANMGDVNVSGLEMPPKHSKTGKKFEGTC